MNRKYLKLQIFRYLFYLLIIGLLTGFPYTLLSLDPTKAVTQYSVKNWDMESGLPGNSIFAILQSTDGYLWIGTQNGLVRFDGVEFTFDANDADYDFLAVYEGLPKWSHRKVSERFEQLSCERSNTLLITTEPSSIRLDGPNFMRQFGWVLTNKNPDLVKHPNQIRQTPPLRWFFGRPMGGPGDWLTFEELSETGPLKTSDLSTVCSTKQMSHTVHAARLNFVMALRKRLPELNVFGREVVADFNLTQFTPITVVLAITIFLVAGLNGAS